MKNKLLLLTILLGWSIVMSAQNGIIKGIITDKQTGEELVGAAVVIDGTTIGTITNFMGEYELPPLSDGTYNVRAQFISYDPILINNVTISNGEVKTVNIQLSAATMDIDEVQVVAKANRESENMLLMEQKNAVIAAQAIGAQELSRKGVSDAEGAVTKISGVSKQDGVKNVFVRGLGDRTNSTTLNGFPMPSEDPSYKNIALDMFPSDIIQSVSVDKVFSSTTTGDVGGANIDIKTKILQSDQEVAISVSGGANAQVLDGNFMKADGVNSFGFANNYSGPTGTHPTSFDFQNNLDPSAVDYRFNQSLGISAGKKVKINDNDLSMFIATSYSSSLSNQEGAQRSMINDGTVDKDLSFDKYDINTNHMVMGNLDYQWLNGNNIAYNILLVHTNSQYFAEFEGYDNDALQSGAARDSLLLHRQQVNDNLLMVNQLYGSFNLTHNLKLNAGLAYNSINSNEPDRRINFLYLDDGQYQTYTRKGMNQRYFSVLNSSDLNMRMMFDLDLNENSDKLSQLSFGYTNRLVADSFDAVQYEMRLQNVETIVFNSKEDVSFDYIYNEQRFNEGEIFLERINSIYDVNKYVHSGLVNGVHEFNSKLVGMAGIRVDYVDIFVDFAGSVADDGTLHGRETNGSQNLFILPSANLKYSINDKHALRFGASRTYTMPQSKELAPFEYIGMTFKERGNPNLQPATNNNLDAKWDYYLSAGEIISIAGFYKHIQDPIARYSSNNAGGFLLYDNVGDMATAAGIEFEMKKNLLYNNESEMGKSHKLTWGLNASYIYTNVKLRVDPGSQPTDPNSQLEGAAPYIVNTDLSYTYKKNNSSITATALFNYFSDRVYSIGYDGMPTLMEKGIPTLDFAVTGKINKHIGVSVKLLNALNPEFEYYRTIENTGQRIELEEYKKGSSLSVGLTYTF
ncbi:TonB-dependent receptor [Saccharicrinis aurantiacus]|uniref:TonB-dependent receptor n=1 Tax=Saccharicrinis aurantiacus TaxID=1849719 RepID=UPI00083820FE|nr:TonB-dependent receptor [Saccharicrinis aurantiacus]